MILSSAIGDDTTMYTEKPAVNSVLFFKSLTLTAPMPIGFPSLLLRSKSLSRKADPAIRVPCSHRKSHKFDRIMTNICITKPSTVANNCRAGILKSLTPPLLFSRTHRPGSPSLFEAFHATELMEDQSVELMNEMHGCSDKQPRDDRWNGFRIVK